MGGDSFRASAEWDVLDPSHLTANRLRVFALLLRETDALLKPPIFEGRGQEMSFMLQKI
jgi:hypothetical protein